MDIVREKILRNQNTFSTSESGNGNINKYIFATNHNKYEVRINKAKQEYSILRGRSVVFISKSFTDLLNRLETPYH